MFANNLKYLREKHKMEQLELAEMLNRKSSSTISEWERGKYTPRAGTLSDISKIFNVEIDDLMKTDLSKHIPNNDILPQITEASSKLHPPRQEKVLKYASKLLEEQKQEPPGNVHLLETAAEFEHDNIVELDFVMGGAVAGLGNYHDDFEMDKIKIPSVEIPCGTDFGILVDGDSMSPTCPNGSIALVEATPNIKLGDIGIFKQGSDVWIKEAGHGKLISHNKDYPDIYINEHDEPIMVIGKVLGYYIED